VAVIVKYNTILALGGKMSVYWPCKVLSRASKRGGWGDGGECRQPVHIGPCDAGLYVLSPAGADGKEVSSIRFPYESGLRLGKRGVQLRKKITRAKAAGMTNNLKQPHWRQGRTAEACAARRTKSEAVGSKEAAVRRRRPVSAHFRADEELVEDALKEIRRKSTNMDEGNKLPAEEIDDLLKDLRSKVKEDTPPQAPPRRARSRRRRPPPPSASPPRCPARSPTPCRSGSRPSSVVRDLAEDELLLPRGRGGDKGDEPAWSSRNPLYRTPSLSPAGRAKAEKAFKENPIYQKPEEKTRSRLADDVLDELRQKFKTQNGDHEISLGRGERSKDDPKVNDEEDETSGDFNRRVAAMEDEAMARIRRLRQKLTEMSGQVEDVSKRNNVERRGKVR